MLPLSIVSKSSRLNYELYTYLSTLVRQIYPEQHSLGRNVSCYTWYCTLRGLI
jgi:hypothetical protein